MLSSSGPAPASLSVFGLYSKSWSSRMASHRSENIFYIPRVVCRSCGMAVALRIDEKTLPTSYPVTVVIPFIAVKSCGCRLLGVLL